MNTTYPYLRHIQQCMLAILVLVLCLVGTAPVTAAQPPAVDYAAIDAYIESQMRELRIPGLAIGIVKGEQIVHLKGFGVAGPDGRPVIPQTPFQLASIGKPMTGVAIMQLVEAGKLDLDAPVQRYLPWFRLADEVASAQITPRHLLYHTSGLSQSAGMEYALSGDNRPDALEARVRELRSVQLNRPVGQAYEYSNAGYMVLGLLIQKISGQSYEAYMQEHVFAPLQMRQVYTNWAEARAHGAATGHRFWFGTPQPSQLAIDRAMLPAGASLAGSVEDVAHFVIAQLNGGRFGDRTILSAQAIAETQRPLMPAGAAHEFRAMDWSVGPIGGVTAIYKGGDLVHYKSQIIFFPERRLGLVVLMNTNRPFDGALGDLRLPMLAYNAAELLVGQPPTSFPAGRLQLLFFTTMFVSIVMQLTGMARTALLMRRWRDQPEQRPQTRVAVAVRIGLPLLLNLGWGLLALVGVPMLLGLRLLFIRYIAPDFGMLLLVSGTVALAWGIARTALLWWVLRTRRPEASVIIGVPIKA